MYILARYYWEIFPHFVQFGASLATLRTKSDIPEPLGVLNNVDISPCDNVTLTSPCWSLRY